MLKKLYNFKDPLVDRQIQEIVDYLNNPGLHLPVFASNAAALAGGLKIHQEYIMPTGERMVVI